MPARARSKRLRSSITSASHGDEDAVERNLALAALAVDPSRASLSGHESAGRVLRRVVPVAFVLDERAAQSRTGNRPGGADDMPVGSGFRADLPLVEQLRRMRVDLDMQPPRLARKQYAVWSFRRSKRGAKMSASWGRAPCIG